MIRQHIEDATKAPPDIAGVSAERSRANQSEHRDAGERRDRETNVWPSAMRGTRTSPLLRCARIIDSGTHVESSW
jgi:hypothetical protein